MASIAGSSMSLKFRPQALLQSPLTTKSYGLKTSVSFLRTSAPRFQSAPLRLRVSCAAKPETVEKVSKIVKAQLAVNDDKPITGETKFAELGADSLDTVEIVMKLEEAFNVTVEEESAHGITCIQEAADLIEMLQQKKD